MPSDASEWSSWCLVVGDIWGQGRAVAENSLMAKERSWWLDCPTLSNVVATRHLSCLLLQTKPYVQQGRFNTLGDDRPSIKTRLRRETAVTRVDTVASIGCHPMISVFLKMKPLCGSESTLLFVLNVVRVPNMIHPNFLHCVSPRSCCFEIPKYLPKCLFNSSTNKSWGTPAPHPTPATHVLGSFRNPNSSKINPQFSILEVKFLHLFKVESPFPTTL